MTRRERNSMQSRAPPAAWRHRLACGSFLENSAATADGVCLLLLQAPRGPLANRADEGHVALDRPVLEPGKNRWHRPPWCRPSPRLWCSAHGKTSLSKLPARPRFAQAVRGIRPGNMQFDPHLGQARAKSGPGTKFARCRKCPWARFPAQALRESAETGCRRVRRIHRSAHAPIRTSRK